MVITHLKNIADLKVDRIESFIAERRNDITIAQGYPNIKKNLPIVTALANDRMNPAYREAKRALDKQLRLFQGIHDFNNIALLSPHGIVVYTSNESYATEQLNKPLPAPEGKKAFEEGQKVLYFSDIFRYEGEGDRFGMFITAPIYNFNQTLIGVISCEVDSAPLYELIQDTTGMGKTGETLIGKQMGNKALFLSPLRHDPEAALKRTVTFGERKAFPIQEAVQGRDGSGLSIDYRGEKIIAVWRTVPSLDYGLVAKIDRVEALASTVEIRNFVIILEITILLLGTLVAKAIAKSLSNPIYALRRGTEVIGRGNLDYKVGTESKDEIGQLSRAFDQMAENLKRITASRDELNKEIAERKKVEKAIKESEEKFRKISIAAQDAIVMMDNEGSILFWNKAAEKMFGYAEQEIVGKELHTHIVPQRYYEDFKKGFKIFKTTGRGTVIGKTLELEAIKKDGREFPVELSTSAITLRGKWNALGIIRDITERKQMEKRLKEIQRSLSTLMSNLPGIAYRCRNDRDWTMEFVSEGCIDLTGYHPSDLIGNKKVSYAQLIHGEDRETVWEQVQAALNERRHFKIVYRIVTAQGVEKWVWEQGQGIFSSEDNLLALEGFITDISERRRMQEELKKHRDYLKDKVEERTAELNKINQQLQQEIINHKATEEKIRQNCQVQNVINCLLQVSLEPISLKEQLERTLDLLFSLKWFELQKKGCIYLVEGEPGVLVIKAHRGFSESQFTACSEVPFDKCICGRAASTRKLTFIDCVDNRHEIRYKDMPPHGHYCVPILSGDRILGVLCLYVIEGHKKEQKEEEFLVAVANTLAGIIIRKEAEKEVKLKQSQLIQADKMASLGIVVSGVAHEINNPNNFIMSSTALLSDFWQDALHVLTEYYGTYGEFFLGGLPFSDVREVVPGVLKGITDGSERIKNIVDDLRDFTRQEKADLNENFNVNEVIRASISILSGQIKKYTDDFHLNLGENLPIVKGNTQKIEQVLINLILNALQALPNRHCGVWLSTSFDKKSGSVIIHVKDEGTGIPEEILSQIIEPFFTTKANSEGIGLGLSISYSIIKEHQGILEFESQPGKGTTAIVKLPTNRP